MELADLIAFAQKQEARFKKVDASKHTPLERTYAQLAKLGEEYGELSEQILAMDGHQRVDKGDKFGPDKLASELADIVICVSILAANLGVNLPDALEKKTAVVDERFRHIDA